MCTFKAFDDYDCSIARITEFSAFNVCFFLLIFVDCLIFVLIKKIQSFYGLQVCFFTSEFFWQ